MATIYAFVFAVVIFAVLGGIGMAIGALFHRSDSGHQVAGPAGTWTTRVRWNEHGLTSGPVVQRVKKLTSPKPDSDTVVENEPEHQRKSRWSDWADAFSIFDETFVWIAALAALVALLASIVLMVVVAIEVALLVLIGVILSGLRTVRAHPWTIEVVDPLGAMSHVKVKGIRRARSEHQALRNSITAGEITTAQLSDS